MKYIQLCVLCWVGAIMTMVIDSSNLFRPTYREQHGMLIPRGDSAASRVDASFDIDTERKSTRKAHAERLVIVVGISAGTTAVHQARPAQGRIPPFDIKMNTGTMKNLELFDNWWSFLPAYLHSFVVVQCLDVASFEYVHTHYKGTIKLSKLYTKSWFSAVSAGWHWRVKLISNYLKDGHTVLVTDIDALWLQDPIPFVLGHKSTHSDIIGLREDLLGWHEINCGFVLYRTGFLPLMHLWEAQMASDKDDQRALSRVLREKSVSWTDTKDGTSWAKVMSGSSVESVVTAEILPSQFFGRTYHYDWPNCEPNTKILTPDLLSESIVYCIDANLMVYHHKGAIYESKHNQKSSRAVSLWNMKNT